MAELAPCGWDPIPCGCELDLGTEESPNDEVVYAVESASYVIWALSGRQFGCCELSMRPCRRDCTTGLEGAWGARLDQGQWINLACRSCAGPCSCTEVCEVRLPHAPACEVTEVVADGVALDPLLWRLEDSEWLVLEAAAGCFPACQDMGAPLGAAGTWGVRYKYGTPPPTAGRRAVGALACEILKACRNDSTCCLPKRTQQYTRQGLNVVLMDPFEFLERRRTGIYEIDLFLAAANPGGRPSGARVLSPDSEPRQRLADWPTIP